MPPAYPPEERAAPHTGRESRFGRSRATIAGRHSPTPPWPDKSIRHTAPACGNRRSKPPAAGESPAPRRQWIWRGRNHRYGYGSVRRIWPVSPPEPAARIGAGAGVPRQAAGRSAPGRPSDAPPPPQQRTRPCHPPDRRPAAPPDGPSAHAAGRDAPAASGSVHPPGQDSCQTAPTQQAPPSSTFVTAAA